VVAAPPLVDGGSGEPCWSHLRFEEDIVAGSEWIETKRTLGRKVWAV
jgi:hypothetical protein